jgi:hypothetical protein
MWSSGDSLVATTLCYPAVPGSNLAISPDYICCSFLDRLPFGMVLHCWLSSEQGTRRKKGFWFTKNKTINNKKLMVGNWGSNMHAGKEKGKITVHTQRKLEKKRKYK